MHDFGIFKTAVAKQFAAMQKHPLFRVKVDRHELWQVYLASFPAGTNPIFRKKTEYDCACCRHFIRDVGDVVAIVNGEIITVWDNVDDDVFSPVAGALATVVRNKPIEEPFLHFEGHAGTNKNYENRGTPDIKEWQHFFVNIPDAFKAPKKDIPTLLGDARSKHDVFARSLKEITLESIDMVLELIAQGSLYRGEEHKHALQAFRVCKVQYEQSKNKDFFTWSAIKTVIPSVQSIRNTVIGTLLVDICEGKELEDAVKSFEAKVAPTNYKRPTALVTKKMVEDAKVKLDEMGLTSALDRRYAVLSDVSINNVIFADRSARKGMSDNVFDQLKDETSGKVNAKKLDSVEEVSIDKFLNEVVPKADSIEVMMENRHGGNLVSLIAPVDPTAGEMFKWKNRFSWSYAGEVADSIKERVKRAGGNVDGDLCCRLAWNNQDDLDLHMKEPGAHIYYGSFRRSKSPNGGMLDLDANGMDGIRTDPAENIYYGDHKKMKEGTYSLYVNQYFTRDLNHNTAGFEVEIDWMGTMYSFAADKSLKQGETIEIAKMEYKGGELKMLSNLRESHATRQQWGLPTQTFHRVTTIMASPNHWDGENVGNRHTFFMLDGCANDGTARGFYNEFLKSDLNKHRKVFEMVGSKMKPAPANEQLSGLGFSSTQRNHLLCRVKGSFTRTIKIVF